MGCERWELIILEVPPGSRHLLPPGGSVACHFDGEIVPLNASRHRNGKLRLAEYLSPRHANTLLAIVPVPFATPSPAR